MSWVTLLTLSSSVPFTVPAFNIYERIQSPPEAGGLGRGVHQFGNTGFRFAPSLPSEASKPPACRCVTFGCIAEISHISFDY